MLTALLTEQGWRKTSRKRVSKKDLNIVLKVLLDIFIFLFLLYQQGKLACFPSHLSSIQQKIHDPINSTELDRVDTIYGHPSDEDITLKPARIPAFAGMTTVGHLTAGVIIPGFYITNGTKTEGRSAFTL